MIGHLECLEVYNYLAMFHWQCTDTGGDWQCSFNCKTSK